MKQRIFECAGVSHVCRACLINIIHRISLGVTFSHSQTTGKSTSHASRNFTHNDDRRWNEKQLSSSSRIFDEYVLAFFAIKNRRKIVVSRLFVENKSEIRKAIFYSNPRNLNPCAAFLRKQNSSNCGISMELTADLERGQRYFRLEETLLGAEENWWALTRILWALWILFRGRSFRFVTKRNFFELFMASNSDFSRAENFLQGVTPSTRDKGFTSCFRNGNRVKWFVNFVANGTKLF